MPGFCANLTMLYCGARPGAVASKCHHLQLTAQYRKPFEFGYDLGESIMLSSRKTSGTL